MIENSARAESIDPAIARASRLLAQRVGLQLDSRDRGRLSRVIREAAEFNDLSTEQYVTRVATDRSVLADLVGRITVQVSSFFRDNNQLYAFTSEVLADIPIASWIWCVGCANGQEPYSLAMILSEAGRTDIQILATDISIPALARTRQASYSSSEISNVSEERRGKFFTQAGDSWNVISDIISRVDVRHHNVVNDELPLLRNACKVVFCRNVLLYQGEMEVRSILTRLADWLPKDAWLFLGHAESLWHVTDAFQLVRVGNSFAYRPTRPDGTVRSNTRVRGQQTGALPLADSATTRADPIEPRISITREFAAGEALASAGDFEGAVDVFARIVELDPSSPIAHFHLALSLEAVGDSRGALTAFRSTRDLLVTTEFAAVEAALGGYSLEVLIDLLDERIA